MRNKIYRTWNMVRKLKNVENETLNLYDQKYGEKHSKTWKMRNAQCRTWNMARILENVKIEKRTL